jgi:hypothetical protein
MRPEIGVLGAVIFAIGGTIALLDLDVLRSAESPNISWVGDTFIAVGIAGFLGFLLAGIGLWLIVQSGKSETTR